MIRKATVQDAQTVAALAVKMWPGHPVTELAEEFCALLTKRSAAVFLAMDGEQAVGFAQCQLRHDYVEGTESAPVGYLEGVFVEETHRNDGHAKALLAACEQWAREQGCSEFASDCELTNTQSLAFHLHCGFREANRIICFTKKL